MAIDNENKGASLCAYALSTVPSHTVVFRTISSVLKREFASKIKIGFCRRYTLHYDLISRIIGVCAKKRYLDLYQKYSRRESNSRPWLCESRVITPRPHELISHNRKLRYKNIKIFYLRTASLLFLPYFFFTSPELQ